jgi:hypothetical protein
MVIDYIAFLTDRQLQEFWLPYTSYLLATATTILLKCTTECANITIQKAWITKLVKFCDWLPKARNEFE